MRIGAALSTDPDPAKAAEEACVRLGKAEVSLALLVASRNHAAFAEVASEALRAEAAPERIIGCVAETVRTEIASVLDFLTEFGVTPA